MSAFASVDEVQARLEWTLDPGERNLIQGALEDLSLDACFHGRQWTETNAPSMIRNFVVRAAARYARNPDGFEQSRAGDETVVWNHSAKTPGSATFSDDEIKAIRAMTRPAGFGSIQMNAWGTVAPSVRRVEGLVPVAGDPGHTGFPLFTSDSSPW